MINKYELVLSFRGEYIQFKVRWIFFFGQKMGGFNEIGNTAIIIRDVKQFLKSIFGPIKIFISYNPVLGVPHWIADNYYYISFMW